MAMPDKIVVNGSEVELERHPVLSTLGRHPVATAIAAFAVALLVPVPALAIPFVGDMITSLFDSVASIVTSLMSDPAGLSILTQGFDNLLAGYGTASTMAHDAVEAMVAAIKSLAAALLSFVMLMQMVKISQRMDQGGQIPALKEVLQLVIMCAIWMYVINHSLDIVEALYDQVNEITKAAVANISPKSLEPSGPSTYGDGFYLLLAALVCWLVAMLARVLVDVMAIARSIQIYVLAMFAPIPLVMLGFDETRGWGVGYIKNFLAVCLSGTIMVVVIRLMPVLIFAQIGGAWVWQDNWVNVVVTLLVSVFALFKSGAWARDVLGG